MNVNAVASPPTLGDYQIEPELLSPPPRRVRERRFMAAWQLWLTRGAVFLFCFFCWLASMSLHDEHDWLRRQQSATGYVLQLNVVNGKSISYVVDFSYNDQKGNVHAGRVSVDLGFYNSLKVNGPFPIYYADDTPENWRLSPASATSIAELQTNWYFGIGVGAVAATLGLWGFKSYRRSRIRLLREGIAAAATVTRRRITKGSKGETHRHLTYEWTDTSGAKRSKEMPVTEAVYNEHPEATPFTVICIPNEPYGSVPYFLINEAVVEL